MWDRSFLSGVRVLTSKTWIRPERSEAAMRDPSERKEAEDTTSLNEVMVWVRSRVSGEKRESEAEWAAAKGWGTAWEKAMDGMEDMRFGVSCVLKEDQYRDSGVFDGVLGVGFSLGFKGKVLEMWVSSAAAISSSFSVAGCRVSKTLLRVRT